MNTNMKNLFYRPSMTAPGLPFSLRTVGHETLEQGSETGKRVIDFVQVIWGVSGSGMIYREGRSDRLAGGCVGVYLPGMQHNLRAVTRLWEYRWITLDGPGSTSVIEGFGFQKKPFRAGTCPVRTFERLQRLVVDAGPEAERRAVQAAFRLLLLIAGKRTDETADPETDLVDDAVDMIRDKLADPTIGVKQIADRLGVHRSALSKRFRARLGIPPKEYIDALRLQNVLDLLRCTQLSLNEIAERSGFSNGHYMAKVFAGRMDMTPTEFRENQDRALA